MWTKCECPTQNRIFLYVIWAYAVYILEDQAPFLYNIHLQYLRYFLIVTVVHIKSEKERIQNTPGQCHVDIPGYGCCHGNLILTVDAGMTSLRTHQSVVAVSCCYGETYVNKSTSIINISAKLTLHMPHLSTHHVYRLYHNITLYFQKLFTPFSIQTMIIFLVTDTFLNQA